LTSVWVSGGKLPKTRFAGTSVRIHDAKRVSGYQSLLAMDKLALQRLEECNQVFLFLWSEIKTEVVTFYGVGRFAIRFEASWSVIVVEAVGVEPIFESGAPPTVTEHVAVPNALEGRHFVVTGASPGLEGEVGVGANGDGQYSILRAGVGRDREAFRGSEFVVGIERRRVTGGTSFAREDLLTARCRCVEFVRVWRWLEGVDVERECIKLLVAVAPPDVRRLRQGLKIGYVSRDKAVVAGERIPTLIESGLTHEIDDGALLLQTGSIKILTVSHSDQIRYLDRLEQTPAVAYGDSCRD
jgi:hypothetical protein